ncbi:MAG TPA: depolymerase [Burkholderiales bacterium]|nr:depolymerase [Burkholderiales bacterium]
MKARWHAALFALACMPALAADALPALGARAQEVTVSGLSSGGYMAVQVHVAHSSIVSGAGVIAGGPYYCAQGSLWTADYNCMNPGGATPLPSVELLHSETEALAGAGRIDPTANLASARAWLFAGTQDRTVYPEVVSGLRAYYASYKTNVKMVADKPAGHAMVVEEAQNSCSVTAPPYINDCDYDAAGELLKHLGFANPPAAKAAGNIAPFDQNPFAGGDAYAISMNDTGYVYVPKACAAGGCRVHVAFHGCRQNGEEFPRDAGYNRWADTNSLIVLYPRTVARSGWCFRCGNFIYNPRACWDWWGYTGPQYHTKDGAQIRAVKAMLDRLSARQ